MAVEAATLKDLLSYRVQRLASLLARGAALRFRREFGVGIVEWRVIALLGGHAPLSLKALVQEAGVDKSLLSRTVSALVARGLVMRDADAADGRAIALRLSASGEALYGGLIGVARQRDRAFRGALDAGERAALERILRKLEVAARDG